MALTARRSTAYLLLLINAFLWGISVPIIKYSLGFVSPSLFLLLRYCTAFLLFTPIFLLFSKNKKPNSKIILLALLGTPLTLLPLFYGLDYTSSIEASVLESTSPVFTVLLSLFILKERLSNLEKRGLLLCLTGAILLGIEPVFSGQTLTFSNSGNILIIISNIVWAFFLIYAKKIKPNLVSLNFYSFVVAIPFFLLFHLLSNQPFTLQTQAIPGILFMALFGSIVAFWAYQEGQKRIEASEAAIFSYLKPIFSVPLSIIWLKEGFTLITVISSLLIFTGVFLSEKR